jgi:hypothetical protein
MRVISVPLRKFLRMSHPTVVRDGGVVSYTNARVGPAKGAAIPPAAREELEIASPGEREGMGKRLVEIVLEHAAPDQHAARTVNHLDRAAAMARRLVKAAAREPMLRVVEHRQHGSPNDIGLEGERRRDHFHEPRAIGILVVVEHCDVVGHRHGVASAAEGAVVGIGLPATGLHHDGERKRIVPGHLLHDLRARLLPRIVVDHDHRQPAAICQLADMGQELSQSLRAPEGRDAQATEGQFRSLIGFLWSGFSCRRAPGPRRHWS